MTVGLSDSLRKVRRTVLIATGVAVATFQLIGSLGLRINTSPSLPMGLYITTADVGANLVEFCPVEPFATLSIVSGLSRSRNLPRRCSPSIEAYRR